MCVRISPRPVSLSPSIILAVSANLCNVLILFRHDFWRVLCSGYQHAKRFILSWLSRTPCQVAQSARLENQMTNIQTNELFLCGECKHHLCIRADVHRVICSITLEFKDRTNVASCEYADRQNADDKTRFNGN